MFLKLTRQFGKPICVLLYGLFALLAGKKKPLPLLALLGTHTAEYFLVGRKVAEETGCDFLDINGAAMEKFASMSKKDIEKLYLSLM